MCLKLRPQAYIDVNNTSLQQMSDSKENFICSSSNNKQEHLLRATLCFQIITLIAVICSRVGATLEACSTFEVSDTSGTSPGVTVLGSGGTFFASSWASSDANNLSASILS